MHCHALMVVGATPSLLSMADMKFATDGRAPLNDRLA